MHTIFCGAEYAYNFVFEMSADLIPKDFYSFESGTPFDRCIECDKYLLDESTEYIIEKAVRNYDGYQARDVIFDYAICLDCAENLRKAVSKQSMSEMINYFQRNLSLAAQQKLRAGKSGDSLSRCMVKNIHVDDCQEYQLFAHCKGQNLSAVQAPYLISGAVIEELSQLLSDATIDEMNGFFNRHFSPDPTLFEPTPKLLLV
ncbi:MAG: hypothetical protein AAF616_07385 [Bacteroidota bacterium]